MNQIFLDAIVNLSSTKTSKLAFEAVSKMLKQIIDGKRITIFLVDKTKRFLIPKMVDDSIVTLESSATNKLLIPLRLNGTDNINNVYVRSTIFGSVIDIQDVYQYSGYDLRDIYKVDAESGVKTKKLIVLPLTDMDGVNVGAIKIADYSLSTVSIEQLRQILTIIANFIGNIRYIELAEYTLDEIDNFRRQLEQENRSLKEKIVVVKNDYTEIVGNSLPLKRVLNLVDKAISSDISVLITGETGTGKELVAHAIHRNGRRRNAEFVIQNCAALPENLLESELFGYRKGAFTGANRDKKGLFELANGGTIFLDEIGDLPLNIQAKLLRVIQSGEIRPLGETRTIKVNVRIVTATHKNLRELVKRGLFREDLYYRISVFPIEMPPLRERKEDIPEMAQYFLVEAQKVHSKNIKGINKFALNQLLEYNYPGNVRELKNIIERLVVLCDDNSVISKELLPSEIYIEDVEADDDDSLDGLRTKVADYEARVIIDALENSRWNQTATARNLKIGRRTLIEKMNRYGIRHQRLAAIRTL